MNVLAAMEREQDLLPLRAWLIRLTEPTVAVIDMLALILIVIATTIAFAKVMKMLAKGGTNVQRRDIWLDYGRWLVAALTFQLAADIIESSIYTTWDAIGQLAAIAVVRTFLNYFLERDMEEIRERQHHGRAEPE
ncbi:MAG TPA: DUF1622 domain-containing protein [Stenotrophomonas sp.]|uniref:DUF1622 domain-containing protein n=1 Tax=Stenotrophomonas pigmentata TaxID=3055080 RepID=UPI0026EB86AB|nr:DUF1622 domain-containing protein [Stenotrophomonas sp. 610A2]